MYVIVKDSENWGSQYGLPEETVFDTIAEAQEYLNREKASDLEKEIASSSFFGICEIVPKMRLITPAQRAVWEVY